MDCRVKPGNDEKIWMRINFLQYRIGPFIGAAAHKR